MKVKKRGIVSRFKPARTLRAMPGKMLPFRPRLPRAPLVGRRQPVKVYGRLGNLEVRLARSRGDVRRAQKLRYHVFYEELSAIPDALTMMARRDEDPYDSICDHLLVVDHGNLPGERRRWPRRPRVVGTYRVLRQDIAELHDGFYSQGEYDISPLVEARSPAYRFLELGRSCVLKAYRNRRTVELLWQGLWTYIRENGFDAMLGCASFEGTDPYRHAMALSYLHHHALAPEAWRARAHDDRYIDMNMVAAPDIDPRLVMRALPPLIKGYLKLGAYVGDGAVIDHQFGTTDVLIILPVEAINERYFAHFGSPDEFASDVGLKAGRRLN